MTTLSLKSWPVESQILDSEDTGFAARVHDRMEEPPIAKAMIFSIFLLFYLLSTIVYSYLSSEKLQYITLYILSCFINIL